MGFRLAERQKGGRGVGRQEKKAFQPPPHPNPLFPSKNELFCFILTQTFIFPESKTILDQIYLVDFSSQI